MRIKLRLTILLTFLSVSVFGQIELAFKCGINFAKVKTTDFPSAGNLKYDFITPFVFGPSMKLDLSDKVHLNSDFLFTQRGFKINGYKTTIANVELPVLLSYSVLKQLDVELGPDFAFKLFVRSDQSTISDDSYRTIDIGVSTGLRYALIDKIILSARYYYGLTSIGSFYNTLSSDSKTYNRVLQFTLGYRLATLK